MVIPTSNIRLEDAIHAPVTNPFIYWYINGLHVDLSDEDKKELEDFIINYTCITLKGEFLFVLGLLGKIKSTDEDAIFVVDNLYGLNEVKEKYPHIWELEGTAVYKVIY